MYVINLCLKMPGSRICNLNLCPIYTHCSIRRPYILSRGSIRIQNCKLLCYTEVVLMILVNCEESCGPVLEYQQDEEGEDDFLIDLDRGLAIHHGIRGDSINYYSYVLSKRQQ